MFEPKYLCSFACTTRARPVEQSTFNQHDRLELLNHLSIVFAVIKWTRCVEDWTRSGAWNIMKIALQIL